MPKNWLEQIKRYWVDQGWDLSQLEFFQMTDDPTDPPEPPPPPERTFTQTEVTAIATREKSQGRAAAERELLEKFGVATIEEAQSILNKAKESDDALKTQAQKDADKAAADAAKADADRKEAARDRLQARIERALQKAGLEDDDEIEMASKLVTIPDDADADTIKAAIDELKTKMPRLFPTEEKPPPKKTGPVGSNPPKPPPTPPPGNTADRAKQLLAERHPTKVKSS